MLAEIGLFQVVLSQQILTECNRVLQKKLPSALPTFTQLLTYIQPEVVPDPLTNEWQRWTSIIETADAPILAAAIGAKVDRLLSLNTKDFTAVVGAQSGLTIQTSGEFIQDIRTVITTGLS
jgi:predicted nucleic acid-binding protein